MKASILISVYNDKRISRCLDSLYNQDSNDFDIIVVENGSSNLEEICKGCRYFNIPEKSIPLARSFALTQSNADYVLFTDADCVAEPDWVRKMVSFLEENDFGGIGGQVKRYNPITSAEIYGPNLAAGQRNLQYYLPIVNLPYVVFANAGFKRKCLVKAGSFDQELLSGNDVDICWKIQKLGYKLGLCDDAIIYHENRKTAKDIFRAHFRYATYQVLLFDKYKKEIQAYKKKKNHGYKINTFALHLFIEAVKNVTKRNVHYTYYDIIESLGISSGIINGSIKFKKIPIY